jgi:hypothetical protein
LRGASWFRAVDDLNRGGYSPSMSASILGCIVLGGVGLLRGVVGSGMVRGGRRTCGGVFLFGAAVQLLLLLVTMLHLPHTAATNTGFWYKNTRPPVSNYDSVAFANMTVKVNLPNSEGPGQNLMSDPFDPGAGDLYVGKTINRQAFDTQFILDIKHAIGIDSHRVFVTDVSKGKVHFEWEATTVIVQFIFLERNETVKGGPTLLEAGKFHIIWFGLVGLQR